MNTSKPATRGRPFAMRPCRVPNLTASTAAGSAVTTTVVAIMFAVAAQPAAAQKLDRNQVPPAAPAPVMKIPSWTRTRLANGAELVISVKKDLPLVSFNVGFIGGATSYEPADKTGLASFVAQMLSEGTTVRTADELSDAQQMLGTTITASIGPETGTIGFTALADRLPDAVALLADMMFHPRLPAAALERIRGRTLVSLQTGRDNPNVVAANVFRKVTYGDDHPYGRIATETSVNAITVDDIAAFHKAYFTPGHAVISVAGDVDPQAIKALVERTFAAWPAGGAVPDFSYPAPPPPKPRTIYLVDKPGAAQSVFQLGEAGPPRSTPDYYALQVLNMILGGLFQSRLNHDIREEKGYSYGVGSAFEYGRGPGAFRAGGGIVTPKSDSALILFMQHLRGAAGGEPFTADELSQGKSALVQSLPPTFSTVSGTRGAIAAIYLQGLAEDFYRTFAARVDAVTADEMVQAARKHIDVDDMNLVIVGDRSVIEEPLRKTGIAPIVRLTVDGKPVTTP